MSALVTEAPAPTRPSRPLPALPQASPLGVEVSDLSKRFGRFPALEGVELEVRPGELLALLGPSGSGKTTLLRLLAGLDFPDAGRIRFGEHDVTGAPAAERGVGFVFQQYALFRHMTVAKNISFGLDVRPRRTRPSPAERHARVQDLLALIELPEIGHRYPAQLSGGQRQRVALARALAVSPRILLLDEPFGALDAAVRKSLRQELRRIHEATGLTTVFVTHDQDEALDLADRVAVLNKGRIEQVGAPEAVLEAPASPFVAGFVGEANRLAGEVRGCLFHGHGLELAAPGVADGPALAFIRPERLEMADAAGGSLQVRVERAGLRGPLLRLEGRLQDGSPLSAALTIGDGAALPERGSLVRLRVRRAQVFRREG